MWSELLTGAANLNLDVGLRWTLAHVDDMTPLQNHRYAGTTQRDVSKSTHTLSYALQRNSGIITSGATIADDASRRCELGDGHALHARSRHKGTIA